MNKIPENEVNAALDAAYKRAGSNAYFASGFRAGIEFAQKKTDKQELIEELRKAVQFAKDSGSADENKAFTARASVVAKLLNLIRKLKEVN